MQRRWFVASGPDSRHLNDVEMHSKRSLAVRAYEQSEQRAKELFSLDFGPGVWECGQNRRVLRQKVY
jgi:hypothetical protein